MRKILTALLAFSVGVLAACGGGGHSTPPVALTVSPGSVNVIAGQTQQFTATVTNATNASVTWSLSGTGCSGAACGSIDANGLYTAPSPIPANATVAVTATLAADATKSGSATVTHLPVSIAVTPNTAQTLISADTKQFSATVSNAPSGHSTFTWSVSGGGTINSSGLYSAPAKVTDDATVTVTATSEFDTTKKTSITITLKAPVITLSPGDKAMEVGAQLQFTATVTSVPAGQNGVTWAVNGPGNVLSGLYTAPNLVSSHTTATVQAISSFVNTKVAQSVVSFDPIIVSVSPDTFTLYPSQTHQFTATVVNHVTKIVSWSVSGESCSGASCGTVDGNGLYTAPTSVANEFNANVIATSIADPARADTSVVTVKPITVTVSPKTASVKVTTTQQFSATVQGGSDLSVIWSVSGTGCNGSACGTIDNNGLYSAPATVPSPATVTVKAASVADTTRFDTATVTLINDPNVKLNGMYAFTFTGFDAPGVAMYAIGSMVADGNGHLTGLIDMDGATYANHDYHAIKQALTGTYQLNASDNRGVMTFTYTSTVTTESFNFRFAIDPTGSRGHFILFEQTGRYGSGTFKRQTAADFSLSKLNGDYAIGMSGLSYYGDERNAFVGRGHLDGLGGVSNTSLDVVNTDGPTSHLTYTGTLAMSSATGMSSGRGTMALSASSQSINFSYYMVNASEAFVIRTDTIGDNAPPYIGRMLKQTKAAFSASDFSGRIAMYMSGINPVADMKSSVFIGAADLSTGMGWYDLNWGGTKYGDANMIVTSTVEANGRISLSLGFKGAWVAYLVAPNTGFIMQYDDPGTMVLFGFFEPQTGGPPFSAATLNGEYFGSAVDAPMANVGFGNGLQNWHGDGTWSGTGDVADPSYGNSADQPVSGTYTITDATNGAGNWLGVSPGTYHKRFYVISPDKIVFIPTEPSNVYPVLEVFEK